MVLAGCFKTASNNHRVNKPHNSHEFENSKISYAKTESPRITRFWNHSSCSSPPKQHLPRTRNSNNLGLKKGASLFFSEKDKSEIGCILKGEMGIDAETTKPESWSGMSRSESLKLAHDEKLSRRAVSEGRLQVKAMRGQTLNVCGGCWALPPRADMGVDLEGVLNSKVNHDALLVVENSQTFDDFWTVRPDVLAGMEGLNPLVLYRGDARGGARADAVNALIEHTSLPIYAFVDYDPAGMVIAAGLPRLDHVVSLALPEMEKLIRKHGITDRFLVSSPINYAT